MLSMLEIQPAGCLCLLNEDVCLEHSLREMGGALCNADEGGAADEVGWHASLPLAPPLLLSSPAGQHSLCPAGTVVVCGLMAVVCNS